MELRKSDHETLYINFESKNRTTEEVSKSIERSGPIRTNHVSLEDTTLVIAY